MRKIKIPLPISMLAVTFTIIYVTMCPALNPWLVDGMLFHPYKEIDTTRLKSINGVSGQEIRFGKNQSLSGWFYKIPDSKYVVLFSHGNAGNISHRVTKIAPLLDCGVSDLIWDYPGFGHSDDLASLKTISADAVATYDELIALGYSPEQIILYGESLGAGINAEIALNRKVKAVIVDSGFTTLHDIAKEKIPIFALYPDSLLPPKSMIVAASLENVPSLIIHAENDEVIPSHHGKTLHEGAPHSKLVLTSASGHNSITAEDAATVQAALKEFIASL